LSVLHPLHMVKPSEKQISRLLLEFKKCNGAQMTPMAQTYV